MSEQRYMLISGNSLFINENLTLEELTRELIKCYDDSDDSFIYRIKLQSSSYEIDDEYYDSIYEKIQEEHREAERKRKEKKQKELELKKENSQKREQEKLRELILKYGIPEDLKNV